MSEIGHLPVLPDKLGKVLTHYFFAIVCQNPKSDMPAPCCTQTQDPNQPPAGRPIPASSESEMRTCIRLCFSDALRGVLRHEKARQGTSTPTGLKRLKTQNTASYDCNTKWERPYLALPNLCTSANSFRKKNSSTLPTLPQYKFVGTITRKGKMSLVGYSYAVWLQRSILLSENVSPDHQLWSMFLLILIQKKKPSSEQKPQKKA